MTHFLLALAAMTLFHFLTVQGPVTTNRKDR